ncbi:MAG: 2-oxo acid dehydrogenase subunit E2 [Chloroflexi bacterium]|nr:2-oxo acid dehydrogenase subunit E2 [Chloroflexota bacterium]
MATTIVMPKMGYDMREGTVVRWYKQEGEEVARGEVIADIETDKATVEFEAFTGGVLHRRVAQEGIPVPVGDAIAIIADPGESVEDSPTVVEGVQEATAEPTVETAAVANVTATPQRAEGEVRASPIARRLARERGIDLTLVAGTGPGGRIVEKDILEYVPETQPAQLNGWVKASPLARRLARERGIDLTLVSGSGPEGRVVEHDVLSYTAPNAEVRETEATTPYQAAAPSPAEVAAVAPSESATPSSLERVELSRMRQAIARVTVDSKQQAPHFYVTAEIDMGRAMELRREVNDVLNAEERVSVNDMVVRACAIALSRNPKFNSFFREDHLQFNGSINVGIAISLESGLMVPGISDCGAKSLAEIAVASKDLIARANSGSLRNEEYSDTTFSISNLGMFDVDSFAAIIFPPHAAVLAVGTVKEQPVVRDGELAIGQVMKATLSTDHRVADGAEAARFLVEVKELLEKPVSLLL